MFATGTEPQVCLGEKTCCTKQIEQVLQTDNVKAFKSKIVKKYEGTTSSLITLYDDLKSKYLYSHALGTWSSLSYGVYDRLSFWSKRNVPILIFALPVFCFLRLSE